MIINELVTKFSFKMGKGLAKYNTDMLKAKKTGDKATKGVAQSFSNLRKTMGKKLTLHLDAQKAKKKLSGIERMIKSIGIAAAGFVGFNVIKSGLTNIAKTGIETENIMARLTTIRGPKQAQKDFKNINKFAAETPFQFDKIASSFARLNAAGFDIDISAMKKLGDVAASSGKGIEDITDAMISASRGQASMVDNFNGLSAVAKNNQLEMSSFDSKTKKMTKTIVKAGDKAKLLDFFLRAGERNDTAGSMEKMSQTLGGLSSTLKDNLAGAMRSVYQAGFGELLKTMAVNATGFVKSLTPLVKTMMIAFSLKVKNNMDKINGVLKVMIGVLKFAGVFAGIFSAYWVGMQALQIGRIIYAGVVALKSMTAAEWLAAAGAAAMDAAVLAIPILIGAAIIAVGLLAVDFYKFFTTGNSMLLDFTSKWPWLHNAITTVYNLIVAFGISVGQIFSAIGNVVKATFGLIKAIVTGDMDSVKSTISDAINGIVNFFATLPEKIKGYIANVKAMFKNMFSGIKMPSLPFSRGNILTRNKGGMVPGTVPSGYGKDSVPSLLTPGELIVPVPIVKQLRTNPSAAMQQIQGLMGKSTGTTSAPAPTYAMQTSQIASGAGGVTINAPMTQQISITGMAARDPISAGKQIGAYAQAGVNRGLSNAARQVPRRVAAPA